ncbi:sensor histidine kinase, partial [Rhizobium ruizarguesonis]
ALTFSETAAELSDSLAHARLRSLGAVAAPTAIFFLVLSALVFRGSRTLEAQRKDLRERANELSALLAENHGLQRRLQRAS